VVLGGAAVVRIVSLRRAHGLRPSLIEYRRPTESKRFLHCINGFFHQPKKCSIILLLILNRPKYAIIAYSLT